jgi:hypothetical protein
MLQLEHYRQLILELEAKIDAHNRSVGGSEGSMKQNIELVTKTSLSKKSIDVKSNLDYLLKGSADLEALKTRVKRIEMNKFTGSQALGSIALDLQNIVSSQETTSIKTSRIITSESFKKSLVIEK